MIRVLAIDPGTTYTGVALVDERGVSCCQTIKFLQPCGLDNAAIFDRAEQIAERLAPILATWKHDVVVMEGWKYYGSIANENSATQTPILVGWLARELRGENLHPQSSSQVFNKKDPGNIYRPFGIDLDKPNEKRLADLMRKIPDGEKAKDEHQRSAVAHAVYYIREHNRLEKTRKVEKWN